MRRPTARVAEGAAVLAALALVPLALVAAVHTSLDSEVHTVVVALAWTAAVCWCAVVGGLARLVAERLRGAGEVESGPLAWAAVRVAALVLLVAPFLDSGPHAVAWRPGAHMAPPAAARTVTASRHGVPARAGVRVERALRPRGGHRGASGPVVPVSLGSGAVLVPLAADVRRRLRSRRRVVVLDERAVDVETALLGSPSSPAMLVRTVARALHADGRLERPAHVVLARGEAWLDDGTWSFDPVTAQREVLCLVAVLGDDGEGSHLLLVPRGSTLALGGDEGPSLADDAVRVSGALGLGRAEVVPPDALLHALAARADDVLVVCDGPVPPEHAELRPHCIERVTSVRSPLVHVGTRAVTLDDGRVFDRAALSPTVRALLDGSYDRSLEDRPRGATLDGALDDRGVVVRLLTAVPRADGLEGSLETARERRATELLAYLALRVGEPVTGDRLRVRVLGAQGTDAAAKTLFNVASSLRRALGDGPFGPRLPPAGRFGHYAVAPDVRCDVALLEARVARASTCTVVEERMAWLRAALELVEGEPFATVLEGYDWFLAEGHLARLQATCEDAACELIDLSLERGLVALAGFALERARLVEPYSEVLAAAAARVAAARQASFEAIAPAARSTEPSAPAVT